MYETYKFDYARNSLKYLAEKYNIKRLYIPYYLCDVIRHALFEIGTKTLFYHIDDNFMPDCDFPKESYLLYPNYFGVFGKNVNILEKEYPNLIVDNAHSFYSEPQGFACFNSERKFRNVDSGSYLYIKKSEVSGEKPISPKPPTNERYKIFINLHKKYKTENLLKFDLDYIKSPFCYPLLAETDEKADKIANELMQDGKTIYRYWNPLPKNYNEYKFYRRLVPIPLT